MTVSPILSEPLPPLDFIEFFKTRTVDYCGEEIKLAKILTWKSLGPALPAEVGLLHLRDHCDGGVLHYVDHFTDFSVAEGEQFLGKTPRVMVDADEWPVVAAGLLKTGVCEVVRESEIHHVQGRPLLNGLFSVSKQEVVDDVEICRLIMNLKPTNDLCLPLTGDTPTLPTSTSVGSIFLDQDDVFVTSSEDCRCFFYLFRVPRLWMKFMAFDRELPSSLVGDSLGGERGYLASAVLPMGFLNSVGIAQHVHRNVVRHCLGTLGSPLGGECEIRRDRFPSSGRNLFRICLGNFDQVRVVDKSTAALLEGGPSQEVESLREAYLRAGLPRHPKKATEQSLCTEVQGAWLDGDKGHLYAKPSKIAKYVALALNLIAQGRASQRELQVVGGGLVYISIFKRPLLRGLNQIWRSITALDEKPSYIRAPLKREVIHELARFIGLLPLALPASGPQLTHR